MANVLDAVKNYFEERNRIWVTGDIRPLHVAARNAFDKPWYQRFRQQLDAKGREVQLRGGKLLRSHSRVQIRHVSKLSGGDGVMVELDERVVWVYRDGADYSVESRIVSHRQHWRHEQGEWVLLSDVESGEEAARAEDGSFGAGVRPSQPRTLHAPDRAAGKYNRVRALRYAELWWDGFNPSFTQFTSDDCTNFVSQCLLAGNVHMTDGGNRAVGWWYRFPTNKQGANWSYSWSTANALALWLTNRLQAEARQNPQDLKVGDVIFYDWQGNGKYGHSTVVVDFDAAGDPLVNAHTDASYHRHYLYLDSRAWQPQTRYLFVHIPDDLP